MHHIAGGGLLAAAAVLWAVSAAVEGPATPAPDTARRTSRTMMGVTQDVLATGVRVGHSLWVHSGVEGRWRAGASHCRTGYVSLVHDPILRRVVAGSALAREALAATQEVGTAGCAVFDVPLGDVVLAEVSGQPMVWPGRAGAPSQVNAAILARRSP